MADRWLDLRLGDAARKIGSGATPKGGKEAYLDQGPFALIRSQNVYNDHFSFRGLAYINDEQARALGNVAVEPADVLLNITGDSVARCAQVDPSVLPARVNQHVAIVRTDPSRLDARFLRYYLISPPVQEHLHQLASAGATRPALTKAMLESLSVFAPASVDEQRAIASILGALDDKIELNRKMSATLEAIARALFKSWFVDFDPVHAKAEGRDPGLPAEIAALFPDSWSVGSLTSVPTGWETHGLDDIASFLNGLALQKFPVEDGAPTLPVIKIAQLRAGHSSAADRASASVPSDYVIGNGDILFSWSGSLECHIWTGGPGALNQHLFKVCGTRIPSWFAYLAVHEHLPEFRLIAAGKATTMGHIQRHHLHEAKITVPPIDLTAAANSIIGPIIEASWTRRLQCSTLGALRDALLPKLISGELRVGEAERVLAASV